MAQVSRRMIGLALLCAALGAAPIRSQDVTEAARQERERKAARANNPSHIYTEEDLKRAKILTPEDQARVISRKATTPVPQKQGQQPQVAKQPEENLSLAEVAQRYREQKAGGQFEEAEDKKGEKSRYPLEPPGVTLAEPKPLVQPNSSLREDELRTAKRPSSAARPAGSRSRISPFVPRNPLGQVEVHPVLPLAVVASSDRKQQVLPGDSWWKLAQRYMGNGSRWRELWRVNPGLGRDPNWLAAGTMVFVPEIATARGSPPDPRISVRPGDTLWSLAREQLGCAQSWPALALANPQVRDYRRLQIGMKLRFPERPATRIGQQYASCRN